MDRAGDRRGAASGLRAAPAGRRGDPRDADRYARDDDDGARSRESASESDGASEDSEEGSVSPEDAELLAKLEAETAADRDADAEAMAAFAKMERARRRTPLHALHRFFAAPARALEEVYANPNSLMTFGRNSELRRACDSLRNNPHFEMFIFVCVLGERRAHRVDETGGAVGRRREFHLTKSDERRASGDVRGDLHVGGAGEDRRYGLSDR
jgi:hypothetical protein